MPNDQTIEAHTLFNGSVYLAIFIFAMSALAAKTVYTKSWREKKWYWVILLVPTCVTTLGVTLSLYSLPLHSPLRFAMQMTRAMFFLAWALGSWLGAWLASEALRRNP